MEAAALHSRFRRFQVRISTWAHTDFVCFVIKHDPSSLQVNGAIVEEIRPQQLATSACATSYSVIILPLYGTRP
jgi:hypothetical protein